MFPSIERRTEAIAIGCSAPKLVDRRLVYMMPEWKDAFRYTTELADRLGLEGAIAESPGWSESGAPWVKPFEVMKKLVWSETKVQRVAAHTNRARGLRRTKPR